MNEIIPYPYFQSSDVVSLSKDLLGKKLVTEIEPGKITSGIIVETEAYRGPEDRASHAFGNRRTDRTEPMFLSGGRSYVYLIYGIHYLFNIVTGPAEIPHAVLIRAIEPIDGIGYMLERRGKTTLNPGLTSGPGKLTLALGIDSKTNNILLSDGRVWVENHASINKNDIVASARINVQYAGKDVLLPWRFTIRDNPFISK